MQMEDEMKVRDALRDAKSKSIGRVLHVGLASFDFAATNCANDLRTIALLLMMAVHALIRDGAPTGCRAVADSGATPGY